MKKVFSLMLLIATIAVACQSCSSDNNEPAPEPQEVEVKLDYSLFESGSMTRSGETVYQQFYNDFIKTKELAPKTYSLSFVANNKYVQQVSGKWGIDDAVLLREGTYSVSGTSAPADGTYFSDYMYLLFNEEVNISKEMTKLTLNAKYDCFLLMFDAVNIKTISATFSTYSGGSELSKAGNTYYLFVNSTKNGEGRDLYIKLTRQNGSNVELNIAAMGLQKGKYYYFNDMTNSFDIDPMENGNQ